MAGPPRIPQGLQHTAMVTGEEYVDMSWVYEQVRSNQLMAHADTMEGTGKQPVLGMSIGQTSRNGQEKLLTPAANLAADPTPLQASYSEDEERPLPAKPRTTGEPHIRSSQGDMDLDDVVAEPREHAVARPVDVVMAGSSDPTAIDSHYQGRTSETQVSTQLPEDVVAKSRLQEIVSAMLLDCLSARTPNVNHCPVAAI